MSVLFNTIGGVSLGFEFFDDYGEKGVIIDLLILRFIIVKDAA